MTAINEHAALGEAPPDQTSVIPDYEQLAALGDEEYLSVSHEFGAQYYDLLTQIEAVGVLVDRARAALEPYLQKLEGHSNVEIAAMYRGYRTGLPTFLFDKK